MSDTSTQIVQGIQPGPDARSPAPARRRDPWKLVKKVLKPLASLRLTVVLFALSMFLVFCGTLAQMDNGLWAILSGYFRAWVAWIPWQVFVRFGQVFFYFPKTWYVGGSFPFPGGKIIGLLLLINLVAAHLVRFKVLRTHYSYPTLPDGGALPRGLLRAWHFFLYRIAWRHAGVLILHSGIILLMLGEFITGEFAVEGIMEIRTGQASNYAVHSDRYELAVIDASNPKEDKVVAVPGSMLKAKRPGELIQDGRLPFDVEMVRFLPNSDEPRRLRPDEDNLATAGVGLEGTVDEVKPVSGTDPDGKINAASAYVVLRRKDNGQSLGTYLVSFWLDEQPVKVDGKEYQIALRLQRDYLPYTLYLEEFRHDLYPGTDKPRNFSSKVRLVDRERGEDREVVIWMNHPLRYRGATFYQAGWIPGDKGTRLQVVTNPGDWMPYVACTLVIVGMTVHFLLHLVTFLHRRLAP